MIATAIILAATPHLPSIVIAIGMAMGALAGFILGYLWRAWQDDVVMDADANELAMLRQQVKDLTEENVILREEYADYSWVEQQWMLEATTDKSLT